MTKTLAGRFTVRAVLVAALMLGMVALASPAWAETFTVTNTNDAGDGSLRQAMEQANTHSGEDKIIFSQSLSGQTITVASSLPHIRDIAGLTIDGEDADITISGNDAMALFEVRGDLVSSAKLTLSNLTVANSSTSGIVNQGTLTVSNSTLSGNSAEYRGGGIYNTGAATVINSTLSGNSAGFVGGGIYSTGTLEVRDSTLSGNSAVDMGGGIHNHGGTLTVSNSTLSDNSTLVVSLAAGNGIYNGGAATLKNTIVANSPSGGNCSGDIVTDGGYNLDSGTTCGFGTDNSSQSDVDPLLGPLADNGGATKTHALLEGSPAIDQGNSFGATTDQRSEQRPSDFGNIPNATGGDGSDIGAYELQAPQQQLPTQPDGGKGKAKAKGKG